MHTAGVSDENETFSWLSTFLPNSVMKAAAAERAATRLGVDEVGAGDVERSSDDDRPLREEYRQGRVGRVPERVRERNGQRHRIERLVARSGMPSGSCTWSVTEPVAVSVRVPSSVCDPAIVTSISAGIT